MATFKETGFVQNACENENCEDHMISKRYPTKVEYIRDLQPIMFVSLNPRCIVCSSFLPTD